MLSFTVGTYDSLANQLLHIVDMRSPINASHLTCQVVSVLHFARLDMLIVLAPICHILYV